ncbi:TPA: SDR family oxidoreductase [Vibrio vulnificus]|uniref:SDR family oxidoreductase n=1 Tax=Vibrio vulnificus TaxID=672 RepID=UPI0005F16BEC|nr:SDR family oxidoreductase [Vibrio vulnificus]MCA3913381.1 SDR family oxidoreductase [Vibrio vulnificus]MCG6311957.1 SDR family oxidoreductase [Vibrio vulnificus]MCU8166250.1 SDR family oxidoreductase [Vibrio vulnificus]MCU8168633.1 SDR family oxidoreductase [Vibrio vulnificus]HAS6360477.1 SDR family oxidoreductase [Vibrio vulnificus]
MTKWVLITGCSSGIGYVCAHALQKSGFEVIASCRNLRDVERLQSEGLTCIQLDLANSNSISLAVQQALEISDGRLYGLFNNGAYGQPGALEDLPTDALRAQFESNFFGWHQLVREILPIMRENKQGRIVQNSSVLGFAAMKYRGAYNASKFAIEGWSDTLRLELDGTNIHIAILEPGPIETRFRYNALQAFLQWIDIENSPHRESYLAQKDRLENTNSKSRFVLPAESCIEPVLHALTSQKPKIRYRVTTPTKLFAVFKRILPTRWLDEILKRAA